MIISEREMLCSLAHVNLPEAENDGFILTPELISRTTTDTNSLLGLYARQTLKTDLLSSTELENDRVGAKDYRRKGKEDKTIAEFSSSSNPLLVQEVFTRSKRNLPEAGETYSDEFILDNVNKVLRPKKINSEKTEDEMLAMTIKRIRKNRKQLINTGAIENYNAVRN